MEGCAHIPHATKQTYVINELRGRAVIKVDHLGRGLPVEKQVLVTWTSHAAVVVGTAIVRVLFPGSKS
jgi:hypothetical protein